jgi:branched-chain amino acid transport system ATP-binding protein
LLKLEDVHAYYGPSHVLQGISLEVKKGELVTLLGRNGMGKTTTMNAIMGLVTRVGKIFLEDKDISRLPTHEIARMGLGYIPQGRQVFPGLTVLENLILGARSVKADKAFLKERLEFCFKLFPKLEERKNQKGLTLSGGEQQMLAIARALMANPKFILMDEPSEGLAPILVRSIFETVAGLKKIGCTILLAEQNVRAALEIADRCYIIEKGQIVLEGSPEEIEKSRRAKAALGV